jgi:hypothetical protein
MKNPNVWKYSENYATSKFNPIEANLNTSDLVNVSIYVWDIDTSKVFCILNFKRVYSYDP